MPPHAAAKFADEKKVERRKITPQQANAKHKSQRNDHLQSEKYRHI